MDQRYWLLWLPKLNPMKEILSGRSVPPNFLESHSFADLHIHTTGSDGYLSPEEAVRLAAHLSKTFNLKLVIAITDHDQIGSAEEAKNFAERSNPEIEVVVGSEISTSEGHIVGLFLNSPVKSRLTPEETICQIHEQGGLVIIPHPFLRLIGGKTSLSVEGIRRIMASTDQRVKIDGFEVCNIGVDDRVRRRERGQGHNRDSLHPNHQACQFYLNNRNGTGLHQLGAEVASSDTHGLTIGRTMTGFKGDLRQAIISQGTLAVILDPDQQRQILHEAMNILGKDRVVNGFVKSRIQDDVLRGQDKPVSGSG